MGSNRIFNVNGRTKEQLLATLKLALLSEYEGGKSQKVRSWEFDKEKGLILNSLETRGNKFPVPLDVEDLVNIVWIWLKTEEAKTVNFEGWDKNADHDGHNELGFRVYCEDWGTVGNNNYAIVAIRPAYIWYGK